MLKTNKSIKQTYLFLIQKVEKDKRLDKCQKATAYWLMSNAYKAITNNRVIGFSNSCVPLILRLNKKSEMLVKAVTGKYSYEE